MRETDISVELYSWFVVFKDVRYLKGLSLWYVGFSHWSDVDVRRWKYKVHKQLNFSSSTDV